MSPSHERLANRQHRLAEIMANPELAQQVEVKVVRFRPHARSLFVSAIVLIVLAAVVPYLMWSFAEDWQNWALFAGAGLVFLLIVVAPFFGWLARTTTVSTKRVIVRSGLFTQHRTEVMLSQVAELKMKRSLWQRMWGAGNIVLQSTFGSQVVLRNVPGVTLVAQAMQELIAWQHRISTRTTSSIG